PRCTITICSPSPIPWVRTQTVSPSNDSPSTWCGTEYCPDSNVTIGVLTGTCRVVPNARCAPWPRPGADAGAPRRASRWGPLRDPMRTCVDLLAEFQAGGFELREAPILR